MGQIFIEAKPISLMPWFNHTYLVYKPDNGPERVIRGGSEESFGGGDIALQIDIPLSESEDKRGNETPEERGQVELNFNGRSAEDVWIIMKEIAQIIQGGNFDYGELNGTMASRRTLSALKRPENLALGFDDVRCFYS